MPHSSNISAPARRRLWTGLGIALAIAGVMATVFAMLFAAAPGGGPASPVGAPVLRHLAAMSAIQAGLSTILSLISAMALAWSLNRLHFPGRTVLTNLFAAAIVTPGLVVALGLIGVWGRAGWINSALDALFGWTPIQSIYGLGGILFAHVLLNGAFAARILLARLDALPAQRLKSAQSLGLGAVRRFGLLDWPAMAPSLPGLAAIIFLLTFTSFPIVLLLGGGPANQTFEVAIYAAVRLDFDLAGAGRLALIQLALCALIAIPAAAFAPPAVLAGRAVHWRWSQKGASRALAIAILIIGSFAFLVPLLAILAEGIGPGLFSLLSRPTFWRALATSLGIATSSAILTLALAIALGLARAQAHRAPARLTLAVPVFIYLAMPALVLSLGFFLAARALGISTSTAAPVVLVFANALLALPFAFATLAPPMAAIARRTNKLSRSLGLSGWQHWHKVEAPLLAPDMAIAAALGFCLSLGDLGVIALFGTSEFSTLPYMMLRAMGAYRSADAATLAALILVLSFGVFAIALVFARHKDNA